MYSIILANQIAVDLPRNIPTPIPHDDRTIDDPMWESPEYDFYTGWLALSNDHAQEMGLPTSMEWPWDASKGVYIFHSYHSLHCVVGFNSMLSIERY